ncbi:hypothetical protein HU719_006045 [Pseudomonas sp. SWRI107]|uniref:hypothetical protein n=1 Tax=Pseudomonas farsensis TaxID=2745492 RepID=UPI0016495149|nr:hypothetical protein [Pseudomonas farsensis]MBV4530965.1 hypothetical protein [Pseudomonas farsensis]
MDADELTATNQERKWPGNRDSYFNKMFYVVCAYVFIGLLVYCASSIIPPIKAILMKKEEIMAAQLVGLQRIPKMEEAIQRMEERQVALTSKSMDDRLSKIESAVTSGDLSVEEIKELSQLAEEVKSLKGFLVKDPSAFFELKELQSNYKALVSDQAKYAVKDVVDSQITTMQWVGGIFMTIVLAVLFSPLATKTKATRPLKKSRASEGEGDAAEEESP